MHIPQIFLLVLIVTSTIAADQVVPSGRILVYGIFSLPGKEEILNTPETSSGKTRTTQGGLQMRAVTNRIPAELKTRFGFVYAVTNLSILNNLMEAHAQKRMKRDVHARSWETPRTRQDEVAGPQMKSFGDQLAIASMQGLTRACLFHDVIYKWLQGSGMSR